MYLSMIFWGGSREIGQKVWRQLSISIELEVIVSEILSNHEDSERALGKFNVRAGSKFRRS